MYIHGFGGLSVVGYTNECIFIDFAIYADITSIK